MPILRVLLDELAATLISSGSTASAVRGDVARLRNDSAGTAARMLDHLKRSGRQQMVRSRPTALAVRMDVQPADPSAQSCQAGAANIWAKMMTNEATEMISDPRLMLTVKASTSPTSAMHPPATATARCFRVIRSHVGLLFLAIPLGCHESIGMASWLGADLLVRQS